MKSQRECVEAWWMVCAGQGAWRGECSPKFSGVVTGFMQNRSRNTGLLLSLFLHAQCVSLHHAVCPFIQGSGSRDERTHEP